MSSPFTEKSRACMLDILFQFWSVYTRCNTQYKDGTERALELIDLIERFTRKYNYFFRMAYSAQGRLFFTHHFGISTYIDIRSIERL